MIEPGAVAQLVGSPVYDDSGAGLGRVTAVYLDDATDRPEWVVVRADPPDLHERFVPLVGASFGAHGELLVGVGRELVTTAPQVDVRLRHLSAEDEERLYQHYDQHDDEPGTDRRRTGPEGTRTDDTGPEETRTEDTGDAMTRSEERLRIDKISGPTGRARLRKYTVTEYVTLTVPVSHEEVRVEHEPSGPSSPPEPAGTPPSAAPGAGPAPGDEGAATTATTRTAGDAGDDVPAEAPDVVLYEERPVVTTERVPVERVRLVTRTVTEDQQIAAEVRRERIAAEGDVDAEDLPD